MPRPSSASPASPAASRTVLAGVRAAQAAGLTPLKINCVLLRGFNDDQIEGFAHFAREEDVIVRFIEFMPLEEGRLWSPDTVVPLRRDRGPHRPRSARSSLASATTPSETARRYTFADGIGEIGIIAPVTQAFCGACSRVRLTSDGKIRTCLFSQVEHDLYGRMRAGASDDELRRLHRPYSSRKGSTPPHRRTRLPQALTLHGPHRRLNSDSPHL